MIHVLYDSGVHDGEPITARDVRPLTPYRVKLATGRYVLVLAGSEKEVAAWAAGEETAVAGPPDRITQLEAELRALRAKADKEGIGKVTAGTPKRA